MKRGRPPAAPVTHEGVCRFCEATYTASTAARAAARFCGRIPCRQLGAWTPEEWKDRARMAKIRRSAGVPLGELDYEALRRAG